jgi:Na+/citrate or Na+/malate symporter
MAGRVAEERREAMANADQEMARVRPLWWRWMDSRIGVVPIPVALFSLVLVSGFLATGTVPSDILMAITLLGLGGFLCAEIGRRLPFLRQFGVAAILATFLPPTLSMCTACRRP